MSSQSENLSTESLALLSLKERTEIDRSFRNLETHYAAVYQRLRLLKLQLEEERKEKKL